MVESLETLTLDAFLQKLRGEVEPILAFKKPGADRVILIVDVGDKYEVWDVGP